MTGLEWIVFFMALIYGPFNAVCLLFNYFNLPKVLRKSMIVKNSFYVFLSFVTLIVMLFKKGLF